MTSVMHMTKRLLGAVEVARQTLAAGEKAAKKAKGLQARAEGLREAVQARRAEAEAELAELRKAVEVALSVAAALPAGTLEAAETLLEGRRAELEAELQNLEDEATAAMAEAEVLATAGNVQTYLAWRSDAEAREEAARQRQKEPFRERLDALLAAVVVGEGAADLAVLARESREAGFEDVAVEAEEAASAALKAREMEAQGAIRRNKAAMARTINETLARGENGDFAVVLREAGVEPVQALVLRPVPAGSGRLRFAVASAINVEAPEEYGTLPGKCRVWRMRQADPGEIAGLSKDQADLVRSIQAGKVWSGYAINRANDKLARLVDRPREQARVLAAAGEQDPAEAAMGEEPLGLEELLSGLTESPEEAGAPVDSVDAPGDVSVRIDAAQDGTGAVLVSPDRLETYRQAVEVAISDLITQGLRQLDVAIAEQGGAVKMSAYCRIGESGQSVSATAPVNGGGADDIVAAAGALVYKIEDRIGRTQ